MTSLLPDGAAVLTKYQSADGGTAQERVQVHRESTRTGSS